MDCKEALEGMVWQFAHHGQKGGKAVLHTGGLSALEDAFEALGWEDPHVVDEGLWLCDVEGCLGWTTAQGMCWQAGGYWHTCTEHGIVYREGRPQPKMKQRAIDREARRGPDGIMRY